jgi:hypothetical protein
MFSKKSQIRFFSNILRYGAVFLPVVFLVFTSVAQTQKPNLPDPVKFMNKFDMVANAVRAALKEKYDIELEDRKAGKITTRPYEFITGSLTASEVNKVAINKNVATGSWVKARYSVEAILEIVEPNETLVTIQTNIEVLNRDVDGTEKWLPLESRGIYERRILGEISSILMGKGKGNLQDNDGFWGQRPQPVDPRRSRFPTPPDR